MSDRDFQRSRLYAWEREVVAPQGGIPVAYDRAQMMVDAVWLAAGLLYPPTVVPMPAQNRRAWAKANRTQIWLNPEATTPEWVVLHEIAHSMAGTVDGESDGHGGDYLWQYMTLVDRHLKIPMPVLMFTANKSGLVFNVGAKPRCLDRKAA